MNISAKVGWLLFGCGAIISVVLRIIFPNFYHHFDVSTFEQWIPYVADLKRVYTTDCYCNYPAIGLWFSSGVMHILNNSILNFLFFLSVIDGINAVLVFLILRQLSVPLPAFWAGIIALLPSTFVGGALWGQIDTIGQTELYVFILVLITSLRTSHFSYLNLAILGGMLSIALLTKQLLLFPVLIFGFLTLIALIRSGIELKKLVFSIGCFILPLLIVDLWLDLPEIYTYSHFQKIFGEGSEHVNFISGNGFNVWMLFVDEMYSSSTDAWIFGLSPKTLGILITGVISIYGFYRYNKWFKDRSGYLNIGLLLLAYALLFLAVNLFFTGTHERYLYHFYPFVLIGLLITGASRTALVWSIFLSIVYGAFVFGILKQYHKTNWFFVSLWAHRLVFILHFLYFCWLLYYLTKKTKKPHDDQKECI